MSQYICNKCGKKFSQKCHYVQHINKKYPCITNVNFKKIENLKLLINEDTIEMSNIENITGREALKDVIHDIHNYMRNHGAGYGMNALKVFNILQGLKKIEEYGLLEKTKIKISFTELLSFANKDDGERIRNDVRIKLIDDIYNNEKLKSFLYYEISDHISPMAWVYLIKKIEEISKIEKTGEQLSGKTYEYFIGRDKTAIDELGAYFTNRHIVNFIYDDLLKITLNKDGSVPSMIDMFGGSGGFTTGYVLYLNKEFDIDWKHNINSIYHYDMNDDVIKSASLELFCLTKEYPNIRTISNKEGNIGYVNSFTFGFNYKKYRYVITNPPYGGDKTITSDFTDKCKKIINFIESKEKETDDKELKDKLKKQKIDLSKKLREKKSLSDSSKVSLKTCGGRIEAYATKYKLTGNDKEACSLILLMDMVDIGGTVCGVLKEGVFFDKKYSNLRKHLVETFDVKTVVSVDNKQFENTGTKTSIIVFHNTGEPTSNVEFYDLVMDTYQEDKFIINDDGIVKLLENKGDVKGVHKEFISSASLEDIMNNEKYSLSGKEYNTITIVPNDGYEIVKLGDICKFQNGYAFKSDDFKRKGIPVVKIKDVKNDRINIENITDFVDDKKSFQKFVIKQNNIVITLTGKIPNLCDVCIYKNKTKLFLNQRSCQIYKIDKVSIDYLLSIIKVLCIPILNMKINGSIQDNIGIKDLQDLDIPIPSSEDKIIEWTERISTLYNDYIDKTKEFEELERQIQIDIQKMIDENPCDKVKLDDICEIQDGYEFKNNELTINTCYIPLIRATYIENKNFTNYIKENKKYNKYKINYGDIIMSQVGNVGSVCKYTNKKFGYNKRNAFRIKTSINNNYVYYYFKSDVFKKMILSNGSIVQFISIPDLKNIKISIPKDKSLIDKLQPTFDRIELLQKEASESKQLYEQFLKDLRKDAIKEIKQSKDEHFLCPEPEMVDEDMVKAIKNSIKTAKNPNILDDSQLAHGIQKSLEGSAKDRGIVDTLAPEPENPAIEISKGWTKKKIIEVLEDNDIEYKKSWNKPKLQQTFYDNYTSDMKC